ncbi:type IV conjugative transfer system protein TraE [Nitrosomonas mobilis]|uniref:Plasmid-like conjugative transfer protein TraE n=1 Tax=Nitrosomonas mobilis TaxID=51642 RepID=A0A1G5SD41_9PROT|nr:type IV conjugative transfer system protein TraE [Nitrosomonas mobilis]SCZ85028.1 Plasmid-like conjugative transfer protein TraE [Nitrosomonas mobilis]HNO76229.1 type IV conjugative transfer system protein TraE [Nitrosomonas mobilis]
MLFNKYTDAQANTKQEILFMRLLLAGSVLIIVLESMAILNLQGEARTVLVPPQIKQSFWVSNNAVSKEYLEEMAYWYAGLALNVTPTGIVYQNELFLKYALPSEFGRLSQEMASRSDFLKRNQTSSQFSVQDITVDEKHLRVALSGKLYTWVADKRAGDRDATFMIGFNYLNGKLYVSDFRETTRQNPMDDDADAAKS